MLMHVPLLVDSRLPVSWQNLVKTVCPVRHFHNTCRFATFSMFGSDDYLIRAYGNCPAFLKNTKDWFKSQEFAVKEAQVAGLLQLLSNNLKQNVTLMDFYNTYDDVSTPGCAICVCICYIL